MSAKKSVKETENNSVAQKEAENENSTNDIEHLRNILFGNHARATEKRLTALENELVGVQTQFLSRLEKEVASIQEDITNKQQAINQAQEEQSLGLATFQQAMQEQLQVVQQELSGQLKGLQEELTVWLEKMDATMRQEVETLRAELHAIDTRLEERKVTRADLGQMLINMGNQLQTNSHAEGAEELSS